jgi:hypothetical protein
VLDRVKIVNFLVVLLALCAVGGTVSFFLMGSRRLTERLPQSGPLVLMDQPAWTSEEMINGIYESVGAREFRLQATRLDALASRLEAICWFENVRVQRTADALMARADWRQPVALVKSGTTRFYVDANSVALEYVPLVNLPLVTVTNIPLVRRPPLGRVVERDDLKAAVALISLLRFMDEKAIAKKPLLREIESVDMANYRGRRKQGSPHIVLYAHDKTPIEWGAEIGSWAQFMEASDEEKLGRLYTYYRERETLQGGVKHINLWNPREIPRPSHQVQVPPR